MGKNENCGKRMKIKFCPKCKERDLKMIAGGSVGLWQCKKCGFRSAIFPEREIRLKRKRKNS